MMTQPPNRIKEYTTIPADFFENDKGEFPTKLTIITFPESDPVVGVLIKRLVTVLTEEPDIVELELLTAKRVSSSDDSPDIYLGSSTLVLIMDFGDYDKIVTMELSASRKDLLLH